MTPRRTFLLCALASILCYEGVAQPLPEAYVRWAELEVFPADARALHAAGSANTAATMALESGVLAFHSAGEKGNPGRMRVLEVYADAGACRDHVQSPHFRKFVEQVQPILRHRQVFHTVPIVLGAKPQFRDRIAVGACSRGGARDRPHPAGRLQAAFSLNLTCASANRSNSTSERPFCSFHLHSAHVYQLNFSGTKFDQI